MHNSLYIVALISVYLMIRWHSFHNIPVCTFCWSNIIASVKFEILSWTSRWSRTRFLVVQYMSNFLSYRQNINGSLLKAPKLTKTTLETSFSTTYTNHCLIIDVESLNCSGNVFEAAFMVGWFFPMTTCGLFGTLLVLRSYVSLPWFWKTGSQHLSKNVVCRYRLRIPNQFYC